AGEAGAGAVEGLLDERGDGVVGDGAGGACGDERFGVGLGEVEALPGLSAQELAGPFNGHWVGCLVRGPEPRAAGARGGSEAGAPAAGPPGANHQDETDYNVNG